MIIFQYFVILKVSPNFTDKDGEFVFGPLCPNKSYSIEIWVNRVKHIKICKTCDREGKCLKGIDIRCEKYGKDDKFEHYDKNDKFEKHYDSNKLDEFDNKNNFEKQLI